MSINIHILNAQKRLKPSIADHIRGGIEDAAELLSAHIDVQRIDVVVQLCEFELYGRAYGPESFTIFVNPADPRLDGFWDRERFRQLAVHELHHVLRWRSLKLETFADWTPGEVLALEGLATQCEAFFGLRSFEPIEANGPLIEAQLERLRPDVGARYCDVRWIDETCLLSGQNIRLASAMGHVLAGRYLDRTGQTPLSAVHAPWRDIFELGMPRRQL